MASNIKIKLRWDMTVVGERTVRKEDLDLDRWRTSVVRLELDPALRDQDRQLFLYNQTLLVVEFEATDSLGRRVGRRAVPSPLAQASLDQAPGNALNQYAKVIAESQGESQR